MHLYKHSHDSHLSEKKGSPCQTQSPNLPLLISSKRPKSSFLDNIQPVRQALSGCMCWGLSAQPFDNPALAELLEISDGWALHATPCVLFSPSPARLGFPRTLAACPRLSARFSAVVNAASPGHVGGHRICPRPPLYAVLLAGPMVTVTSASFPDPASIDGAFIQQGNPRIPHRRSLTRPNLSPTPHLVGLPPCRTPHHRQDQIDVCSFQVFLSHRPPCRASYASTGSNKVPLDLALTSEAGYCQF